MKSVLAVLGLCGLLVATASAQQPQQQQQHIQPITVTSPAFQQNGQIPAQYTCDGTQSSPPLAWAQMPPQVKSIAIVVDDPDAPGGTYEHLVLYNLPPTERSLASQPARGKTGQGAAALNSNQDAGWAPICPPNGRHHYRFMVVGLDQQLQLPLHATSRDVDYAMRGHIIAHGQLVGTYQRGAALKAIPQRPMVK